jgi:hypothetical protein
MREQELLHQLSALRSQIEAKENELVYVRKAKEATSISVSVGVDRQNPPTSRTSNLFKVAPVARDDALDFFKKLTIKQLVMQAMIDHFLGGATSQSLREFIRNAYGREIEQESLRPQLHRLKAQELLLQDPSGEKWLLGPLAGRLSLFNADSRAAIQELRKDELPDRDDGGEPTSE